MSTISCRPRYDYDQCGGFGHGWRAVYGSEPLGPVRMFQWEAVADLPDEAFHDIWFKPGYISTWEPFGVHICSPEYVRAWKRGEFR